MFWIVWYRRRREESIWGGSTWHPWFPRYTGEKEVWLKFLRLEPQFIIFQLYLMSASLLLPPHPSSRNMDIRWAHPKGESIVGWGGEKARQGLPHMSHCISALEMVTWHLPFTYQDLATVLHGLTLSEKSVLLWAGKCSLVTRQFDICVMAMLRMPWYMSC